MRWLYLLIVLISFQSLGQVLELYKDPNRFIYNYTPEKVERNSSRTLIWEEDFANGLAGNNGSGAWEVFGPDSLIWKHDFWGTSGEWSASTPSPNTTTVTNGFMLFDADSANFPLSPNYVNLNASLMSPRIDLSGQSSAVLSFEHWFQHCCSGPSFDIELDVSTDNGVTWTTYNLDSNISQSTSPANPTLVELNLTSLIASEDSVRLRFNWVNSSHYFWVIDDIRIEEAPPYDLKLENFVWETVDTTWGGRGIAYTHVKAQNSLYDFLFSCDIKNNGANMVAYRLELSCYLSGNLYNTIYGDTVLLNAGDSYRDSIIYTLQNNIIDHHHFELKPIFDSSYLDLTPDNMDSTSVFVEYSYGNPNLYSKTRDNQLGSGLWNGQDSFGNSNTYVIGTVYEFNETHNAEFFSIDIDSSTDVGSLLYLQIYQIDTLGNFILMYDGAGTQHEITINNSHIGSNVHMSAGCGNNSPTLQANIPYLVSFGHYGGPDKLVVSSSDNIIDMAGQSYILDGTDNTWYYIANTPSISVGGECIDSIDDKIKNIINLHPNPTSNQLHISLESIPQSYQILDLNGKLIMTEKVNEQTFIIDVQGLTKGMYILQIHTEDGVGQEKFVVE